ncbi:ATP-dependent DNA ligase LigD phosphoesterase module /ATP-dependent DNA ligase LigD polymerase module [Gillisia mitskevichiae]|uniref:DNA ligase (ATP) n=1 Tax=Gillisia mitskevichiae TaxID=270921 RepID=A0A495PVA2_9FLAO|nr:DNA ligase D [Gillisia mitskevichiae]RKS53926.1 ATP-dependent DNA ligase LigD phosphoesterase module /ATP-dependent DNA ligase LigD polymerase module [Gillisia mitskevichiae]
MALHDYNKKRDFNNTPEPPAELSHENAGRFVIQRHKASRLHYDLRLEMEGVLKSWAIPKGPSMNPDDKRLAIQTEDHPVKYLSFQGTIPKGNYGAGVMKIWDEGTYNVAPEFQEMDLVKQFEKGDLKIEFFGKKIKGTFALVHTKRRDADNHWLLIKKKDSYSTDLDYDAEVFSDAKKPSTNKDTPVKKLSPEKFVKPMLASSIKDIFNDKAWVYELKWDGYRVMANIKDGKVHLYSRNGIAYNSKFKQLVKDLEHVENDVILDGEVVVVNENGLPQFQALQNYDENTSGILRYYVFDMLYLNGHSMLDLDLLERKSLIPEIIENLSYTLFCDHIEGMGTALYKKAIDAGMEGVIAKKIDSTYSPGYRSEKWLKIKAVETEEVIICGYTDSESGGAIFGSLILGMFVEDQLKYIGNCGSGFSAKDQRELLNKLKKLEVEKHPFKRKPNLKGRNSHWVSPILICEVKFSEWTKSGLMRHPVYKGIRSDRDLHEVSKSTHKKEKVETRSSNSKATILEVEGIDVPITNLEKVLWPDNGYTKYDLIDYYLNVSDYILPYLKDRPQSLHRHPNGIKSPGFFQKDNENLPSWIKTEEIFSKSTKKNINYLLCQNEASLLYMANLGCIEINPWHSRVNNLDYPDYTIIDLDPSKENTFEEVITVGQAAKEVLDLAKIKGFCKTSGSSGLHIYIPLNAKYTYEEARNFTKLLCYFIEQKVPELTSMLRAVKDRKGKIYLDYLQNRKGQTIAAPYCVRPKTGAPVSTPLEWKEVKSGLKILDFNIKNIQARIQEKGDLFAEVLSLDTDMMAAIQRLEN